MWLFLIVVFLLLHRRRHYGYSPYGVYPQYRGFGPYGSAQYGYVWNGYAWQPAYRSPYDDPFGYRRRPYFW